MDTVDPSVTKHSRLTEDIILIRSGDFEDWIYIQEDPGKWVPFRKATLDDWKEIALAALTLLHK